MQDSRTTCSRALAPSCLRCGCLRVADAIVKVSTHPLGRPFRVHIDPSQDGAEVVNAVSDRVRIELLVGSV